MGTVAAKAVHCCSFCGCCCCYSSCCSCSYGWVTQRLALAQLPSTNLQLEIAGKSRARNNRIQRTTTPDNLCNQQYGQRCALPSWRHGVANKTPAWTSAAKYRPRSACSCKSQGAAKFKPIRPVYCHAVLGPTMIDGLEDPEMSEYKIRIQSSMQGRNRRIRDGQH